MNTYTIRDIAEEFNYSTGAVHGILSSVGVEPIDKVRTNNSPIPTNVYDDEARLLFAQYVAEHGADWHGKRSDVRAYAREVLGLEPEVEEVKESPEKETNFVKAQVLIPHQRVEFIQEITQEQLVKSVDAFIHDKRVIDITWDLELTSAVVRYINFHNPEDN